MPAGVPITQGRLLIYVEAWLLKVLTWSQGKHLTKNTLTVFFHITMLRHTQSFLRKIEPSATLTVILFLSCISKVCMSYLGLFINLFERKRHT